MQKTVYVTRGSNSSLISRGLQNVFIWFHEPCLEIEDTLEMFDLKGKDFHDSLKNILYGHNCKYNFIYRSENNINSDFGNLLIRNDDGIDFPEKLIELKNNNELYFKHVVFGSGRKVGFRPINAGDLFGYESEESEFIWNIIKNEFKDIPYTEWDKYENEIPWWRFCKKIQLNICINK